MMDLVTEHFLVLIITALVVLVLVLVALVVAVVIVYVYANTVLLMCLLVVQHSRHNKTPS